MILSSDVFKRINLFHEPELREQILKHCNLQTFDKGDVIVREGQFVKVVPIVVTGMLRVYQTRDEREILLYHVEPSQTCMMSLSACFFNNESPSQAIAKEKTKAITVPVNFVTKWQKEYTSWNEFVIRTFRNRYDELLSTFDSIAFDHIDKRVLDYLKSKNLKTQPKKVELSHQELANELGTTRVVVSRILKQFEMDKVVVLHRGFIEVL